MVAILTSVHFLTKTPAFSSGDKQVAAIIVMVTTIPLLGILMGLPQFFQSDHYKLVTVYGITVVVFTLAIWMVIPELFPHGMNRLMAVWGVAVAAFLLAFVAFGSLSRPREAQDLKRLQAMLDAKTVITTEVFSNATRIAKTTQDPDLRLFAEHSAKSGSCLRVLVGPSFSKDTPEKTFEAMVASNGVSHPKELAEWQSLTNQWDEVNAAEQACRVKFFPGPGWLGLWISTVCAALFFWFSKRLRTQ